MGCIQNREVIMRLLAFFVLLLQFSLGWANSRLPDVYAQAGIDSNRTYQEPLQDVEVDPFTGKLHITTTDLSVPLSGGETFEITRSYTSSDKPLTPHSLLGKGWIMHFGRIIAGSTNCTGNSTVASDNPVLELPDGSRRVFFVPSQASSTFGDHYPPLYGTTRLYVTQDHWIATCDVYAPDLFIVRSPSGTKYEMKKVNLREKEWYVTKITYRSDEQVRITYHADNSNDVFLVAKQYALVDKVYLPNGKSVEFNYRNYYYNNVTNVLIWRIVYDGRAWEYMYDTLVGGSFNNWLTHVVRPDGSRWSFIPHLYGGNYQKWNMAKATNPYGGEIGVAYEGKQFSPASHGVTSVVQKITRTEDLSRGTPGGTWSYQYEPGYPYAAGALDKTTITGPLNRIVVSHYGYQAVASNGEIWRLGLLKQRLICGLTVSSCSSAAASRVEDYEWGKLKVSTENVQLTRGMYGYDAYKPILTQHSISQDGDNFKTIYASHDAYGNPWDISEIANDGGEYKKRVERVNKLTRWVIGLTGNETHYDVYGVEDFSVQRDYTPVGYLLSETQYGVRTEFGHYASGDLEYEKDAKSHKTVYKSYVAGIPQRIERPEGVVETQVVNSSNGTITSKTDPHGNKTIYHYDSMLRVKEIDYPVGYSEFSAWNVDNYKHILSSVTTKGPARAGNGPYRETNYYNGLGLVYKKVVEDTQKGIAVTVKYGYDAEGALTFKSLPNNTTKGAQYRFDTLGRLKTMTSADGYTIRHEYLAGSKEKVTDQRNHVTEYTYRSFGRPENRQLVYIDAPEGVAFQIQPDKLGNIRTIKEVGSNTVRNYHYDTHLHLEWRDDPETGRTRFYPDIVGNRGGRKVADSPITDYVHNDLDRLERVDHSPESGLPDIVYDYDLDRLRSVSYGDVVRSYDYDGMNRIKSEKLSIGIGENAVEYVVSYHYDDYGTLSVITYPDGEEVTYNPDALMRKRTVGGYAGPITYWPSGQVKRIDFSNGVFAEFQQWENSLLMKDVSVKKADQSTLLSLGYVYDPARNLKAITDSVEAASAPWELRYDGVNRLSHAEGIFGTLDYGYNTKGDIESITLNGTLVTDYRYSATTGLLEELTGAAQSSYSYDVYGNIDSVGQNSYRYAEDGTMVGAGINGEVVFGYDGEGRLAYKRKQDEATHFFYNHAGDLLYEHNLKDRTKKKFYRLNGQLIATKLYAPNPPVARITGSTTGRENEILTLDAGTSTTENGELVSYRWAQLSGPVLGIGDNAAASVSVTLPKVSGDMSAELQLTVTDELGLTDTAVVAITIVDKISAVIVGSTVGNEGTVLHLDAGSSSSTSGTVNSFTWTKVSGDAVDAVSGGEATLDIPLPDVGKTEKVVVQLSVADTNGLTDQVQHTFYIRDLDRTPDGDIAPLGARDGKVTIADALTALRYSLGWITPIPDDDLEHGDVAPLGEDGLPLPDGRFSIADALLIQRKALGLVSF